MKSSIAILTAGAAAANLKTASFYGSQEYGVYKPEPVAVFGGSIGFNSSFGPHMVLQQAPQMACVYGTLDTAGQVRRAPRFSVSDPLPHSHGRPR